MIEAEQEWYRERREARGRTLLERNCIGLATTVHPGSQVDITVWFESLTLFHEH